MNGKKNIDKLDQNTKNLNRVRQQFRNKLIQAGLIVEEVQNTPNHKKKSKIKKPITADITVPFLHSFRSHQFSNKSFKHKISPEFPQIFSFRHINLLSQKQQRNRANSIENSRNNSMNFGQIIRKKIMDDVRYPKVQLKCPTVAKDDRKIMKISTQGPEMIIIQSLRQSKDRKHKLMLQQSIKNISKYRSKTEEQYKPINPEVNIPKITHSRALTPWQAERQTFQM